MKSLLVLSGFVTGLVLAVAAVVLFAGSDEEAGSQPGVARGRWANTTYPLSVAVNGQAYEVFGMGGGGYSPQTELTLKIDNPPSDVAVAVDALTGTVTRQKDGGTPQGAEILRQVIAGIKYEEFNPKSAPWPYRDEPDVANREPDPLSGIQTQTLQVYGGPYDGGKVYSTWQSTLTIWDGPAPGFVDYTCEKMADVDREAFARLLRARVPPGTEARAVALSDKASCELGSR